MKHYQSLAAMAVVAAACFALAAADGGRSRADPPPPAPPPPPLVGEDRPSTPAPAPAAGPARNAPADARPASAPDRQPEPQPEPIELSGRLRRPVKWSPQLELAPAGQIKHFDLHGELLKGIKEGTPLRVRGVVRSSLHRGGTKDNPSPFPPQWMIWLEVTEMELLDHLPEGLRVSEGPPATQRGR